MLVGQIGKDSSVLLVGSGLLQIIHNIKANPTNKPINERHLQPGIISKGRVRLRDQKPRGSKVFKEKYYLYLFPFVH